MSAPQVQLTGGAVAVLVGLAVGGVLLWQAAGVAGKVGKSLAAGLETISEITGQVVDTVKSGAQAVSVNYAQDVPANPNPYGITMTPAEQAIADNYQMFSWFPSASLWGASNQPEPSSVPYAQTADERAWAQGFAAQEKPQEFYQ